MKFQRCIQARELRWLAVSIEIRRSVTSSSAWKVSGLADEDHECQDLSTSADFDTTIADARCKASNKRPKQIFNDSDISNLFTSMTSLERIPAT